MMMVLLLLVVVFLVVILLVDQNAGRAVCAKHFVNCEGRMAGFNPASLGCLQMRSALRLGPRRYFSSTWKILDSATQILLIFVAYFFANVCDE